MKSNININENITNHTPKISVIIPLYNKKKYIKRAIDSVLAQTIQDFEIIIINDGSIDGSEKIVQQYNDTRIHLINQENNGVSYSRNLGVSLSKSDLVTFLDADDELLPLYIETILKLRQKYPNGGIFSTSYYVCDKNYKKYRRVIKGISNNWEGIVYPIFKYVSNSYVFPGCASTTAIPRDLFIKHNGFNINIDLGEDLEFFMRLSLYYPYVHSSQPLGVYYHDDIYAASQRKSIPSESPIYKEYKLLYPINEQKKLMKEIPYFYLYLEELHLFWAKMLISDKYYDAYHAKSELKYVASFKHAMQKIEIYIYIYFRKILKPYIKLIHRLCLKS